MAIFPEKRGGVETGRLVVEVIVNGKPVKRRAPNMKEAKLIQAKLQAGLVEAPKSGVRFLTVEDMRTQARGLWRGDKDEKNSLRKLDKVCNLLGLKRLVKSLTTLDMDKLQADLRAEGLADATINRYNAVVTKVMRWAQDRNQLEKLPKVQWFTETQKKFSWIKPEDEKRLIEWLLAEGNVNGDLGGKVAVIVRTLVITGVRIGELLKAEPDHFDLDAETITLWDTKTGDSRTQHLPKEYGERLRSLKLQGSFPSYQAIQGVFYRARAALELDPGLTLHGLRHTTATRLMLNGVNHRIIMDYMGHKSVITTNRYAHVNTEAKRSAAQALIGGTL